MGYIKRIMKNLLLKNPTFYKVIYRGWHQYQQIIEQKRKIYEQSIVNRSNLRIEDFIELAKDLPLVSKEYTVENDFYGNANAIRNRFNLAYNEKIEGYIEHGVYLGGTIAKSQLKYFPFETIYTFGRYRKKYLERYIKKHSLKKKIIEVGPYILFSPNYYDEEKISRLKLNYGKTLLLFPSHSIEGVSSKFDQNLLIDEILKIKTKYCFQTIVVCMYWKDILEEKYIAYQERGFKIMCAGHRSDVNFLSRLKTIISLSDMTVSNQIGTHIGYCIALGKPHYLISQNIQYSGIKAKEEFSRGEQWDELYKRDVYTIKNTFGLYSEKITKKQQEIVEYYWGKI